MLKAKLPYVSLGNESHRLSAFLLVCCGLLVLSGCTDGDSDSSGVAVGEVAYVSMSFTAQGKGMATRADSHLNDAGVSDVLQEGATVNESQIHAVLVALFSPVGSDAEKELEYLFWYVDDSAPLLQLLEDESTGASTLLSAMGGNAESVVGILQMNSEKTISNSSLKTIQASHYHTLVYGNMVSPKLCMSLVGATTLTELMTMTQQTVKSKNIRMDSFKQKLASYSTGPLSSVGSNGNPTEVALKETTPATVNASMLGGYSDKLAAGQDLYHQSFYEAPNLNIPRGYNESAPFVCTLALKRSLAKIRVNLTNIDETGHIYDGTDEYWLNADEGIKILNWIPFAPNCQWKDYPLSAALSYDVKDGSSTTTVTGLCTLNVSRMQQDYPAELSLEYYLTQQTRSYMDGMTPREVNLLQGAIDGLHRTSSHSAAYNAELFNCYIAPWSPLFSPQTSTVNTTAIQIKFEKRDGSHLPIAGTERVYTIPLYNATIDPQAATPPLFDTHEYLPDGTYTDYTILRNYLYQIDVVFMGPAGLQWKIRAVPEDWVDDGEEDLDLNL